MNNGLRNKDLNLKFVKSNPEESDENLIRIKHDHDNDNTNNNNERNF